MIFVCEDSCESNDVLFKRHFLASRTRITHEMEVGVNFINDIHAGSSPILIY